MNILFIGDKKGRVHYDRFLVFQKYIANHSFSYCSMDKYKKCQGYDAVYLASCAMQKTLKIKHKHLLGSITSWKLFNEGDKFGFLSDFKRVSVNNLKLFNLMCGMHRDLYYLPNGVETDFFTPGSKEFLPEKITFGWIGNIDREEKNFEIIRKLKQVCRLKTVETKKKQKNVHSKEYVRDFYRQLDFYIVCSSFEGTPNPALEAASCGVPLVTTRVGNMPEIIVPGVNGYFLHELSARYIVAKIQHIENTIKNTEYEDMSTNIRKTILGNWGWNKACEGFLKFFET